MWVEPTPKPLRNTSLPKTTIGEKNNMPKASRNRGFTKLGA